MPGRTRLPLLVLAALALTAGLAGGAQSKVKLNSENNKKLGPRDNPGQFMGYPSPTYQWHGCTKTATVNNGRPPTPGAPARPRGNRQSAVTFTVNRAAPPYFRWKAKAGYRICGVQATVELSNPQVRSDLLAEVGYTSGSATGSTAGNGKETIRVRIAKNDINHQNFREFEGKTYSISVIQDLTVFVKAK
jgi:hypothetical protein